MNSQLEKKMFINLTIPKIAYRNYLTNCCLNFTYLFLHFVVDNSVEVVGSGSYQAVYKFLSKQLIPLKLLKVTEIYSSFSW